MKNLFALLAIASIFAISCNNTSTKNTDQVTETQEECGPSISVDSFLVIAPSNVGKELTVKGTIDHVCKHGGKRVKIFSSCASKFIHGEAGEDIGAFKAELEGSDVCLTGIVLETKIDMAYVDEWEAKEAKAIEENAEEADMEHKKGVDHHAKLDEIKKYREDIEASENGYIGFYSLEVSKYTECKTEDKPCCADKKGEVKDSTSTPCADKKEAGTDTTSAPCGDKKEGSGCCGDKKEAEAKPCGSKS